MTGCAHNWQGLFVRQPLQPLQCCCTDRIFITSIDERYYTNCVSIPVLFHLLVDFLTVED